MSGEGYNEVVIVVNTSDAGQAIRDKIKADNEALGKTEVTIPVKLSDPVTDAWRAQVNAEIKAAAKDALNIPVNADTEALRTEVAEALADAKSIARLPVPVELADAEVFRASVEGLVASVRAEIATGIEVPVTVDTNGARAQVADLTPQPQDVSGASSFRPSYTPAPLGPDPYAAARTQMAGEPPIELPVVAADPITEAWRAQVTSELRTLTAQAVKIPVTPDTAAFREQVSTQLAELSDLRETIPLEANTDAFRMEVTEQVEAISQTVRAVITVETDSASLADLRTKILAAADASTQEAQAQKDLSDAMAKGDPAEIAKAQEALAAASKDAGTAAEAQATAMDVAAEAEVAAAAGADTASFSMRSLNAAMGPLWMIMNVAQIAMMGFYATSQSTSTAAQDLSQQLIGLGQSGSNAAQSLTGNDSLKTIASQLSGAGTSAAAFSQAYSGSLGDAETYTQKLIDAQKAAGSATATLTQQMANGTAGGKAAGETYQTTSVSIAQLADKVNSGQIAMSQLSQANQDAVNTYNNLVPSVKAAKQALDDMQAAQAVTLEQLFSSSGSFQTEGAAAGAYGLSLGDVEQAYDSIKLANPKDTLDQVSAAFDSAVLSANQAAMAIGTAYTQQVNAAAQATTQLASANHSLEQAGEGVANAEHGVQQAQLQYNNALEAEQTAQQAVASARAQAAQQLITLRLQEADAAAASLSANVNLYDAQKAAAALGVTPGNAQAIASQQITDANEAQVKAAISLLQAENQVADSQNTSSQAQDALNTARQQGIDGNPAVIAANRALQQAEQQVASAAYAEQQAHQQVANALWSEQQAAVAVTAAQVALRASQEVLSNDTNLGTQAGQQMEQMILQLGASLRSTGLPLTTQYNDLIQSTAVLFGGSTTAAANYLKQIGAIPQDYQFGVTAVAQVDLSQLIPLESSLHMSLNNLNGKASGGPAGGLAVVGEHGPEVVHLAPGSQVMPASNSAALLKGYAAGGVVGTDNLVGNNVGFGAVGIGYQDSVNALNIMGMAAPPGLPRYVPQPAPSFGGGGGSNVSGSRAANKAIMQAVFSTFGWGSGAEWAAQDYVEMREAGYNNLAQNPHSTAFGMGQFLDGTWGAYGFTKTADPYTQSLAMAMYEKARYGHPIGAAAHEQAYNWYANGGPTSGGVVGLHDQGAELARLPNGSMVLPHANTSTLLGQAQALQVDINVEVDPGADGAFASVFKQLVRTGQIRFTVQGNQVAVG